MIMIRAQRHLLLKRLDLLSAKLKVEVDSLRADSILEEMRNIGKLLKELVHNSVPDHKFVNDAAFKEQGSDGYKSRIG